MLSYSHPSNDHPHTTHMLTRQGQDGAIEAPAPRLAPVPGLPGAVPLPPGFGAFRAEVEASLASEAAVGGQTLGARPSPRGRQRAGDPAREPVGKLGARQSDEWEKQKLLGLMQATDL